MDQHAGDKGKGPKKEGGAKKRKAGQSSKARPERKIAMGLDADLLAYVAGRTYTEALRFQMAHFLTGEEEMNCLYERAGRNLELEHELFRLTRPWVMLLSVSKDTRQGVMKAFKDNEDYVWDENIRRFETYLRVQKEYRLAHPFKILTDKQVDEATPELTFLHKPLRVLYIAISNTLEKDSGIQPENAVFDLLRRDGRWVDFVSPEEAKTRNLARNQSKDTNTSIISHLALAMTACCDMCQCPVQANRTLTDKGMTKTVSTKFVLMGSCRKVLCRTCWRQNACVPADSKRYTLR
jgi:hypothetical protein